MRPAHRAVSLLAGVLLAASCSTPPVTPSPSGTGAPSVVPSTSPVAIAPSPTPLPPLPTETGAHLTWTKAKTNLPPRVSHGAIHLAVPPDGSSRYVLVDAFWEVWRSADGASWASKKDVMHVPGPWTTNIATFGGQVVAFDRTLDYSIAFPDGPYGDLSDGRTWLSTSGLDWSRHASPIEMVDGIVDGDRLVATGGVKGDYQPSFGTSTDGATWTIAPKASGLWPGDQFCWWNVRDLEGSSGDGFVVDATRVSPYVDRCGPGPSATSIWRSADLRSWAPVLEASSPCNRVYDIVHGPRGFVAIGVTPNPGSVERVGCAWASRDGIVWIPVSEPPPVVTRSLRQLAVAPDGTFLAYGDEIWESTDGLQWYLSTPATNVFVYDIAGDLAVGCADDTCYTLRMAS